MPTGQCIGPCHHAYRVSLNNINTLRNVIKIYFREEKGIPIVHGIWRLVTESRVAWYYENENETTMQPTKARPRGRMSLQPETNGDIIGKTREL